MIGIIAAMDKEIQEFEKKMECEDGTKKIA